ncbi:MAG: sigma-54-dependent Fis family transcriptional regulator, partial [Deltaproteobacteria bacterium]
KQLWQAVEKQVIASCAPTWYVEIVDSGRRDRLYFEKRMQPIKDPDGKVSLVVGIVSDITTYVKKQITLANEIKELRVRITGDAGPNIVGKSKAIVEVLGRIKAISSTDTTVLVTGESGSGKELVAEAIHQASRRSMRPLIKINCGALPESLIESELFGHVKGAFTGAVSSRIGRFQAAHRGTIFLDEIGNISEAIQVRLLRILEDKKVERVGDYKPTQVDVRIIAATNQNLEKLVEKGRFREDLYYRLNVFNIHTAPLRERLDDIPLLVGHFLGHCSREMGKEILSVSNAVMDRLLEHSWRGNVRELRNVIESACVLCPAETIQMEHLPPLFDPSILHVEATKEKEIIEALRSTGGNKAKAARLLGIDRRTLYRRMKRYNIVTN